jgi:cell wall-associated NlpC family hydrolase
MSVHAQNKLRLFLMALPAALIVFAVALGVTSSAHATSNANATAVAANAVDGYCDPWNDVDDPDCWGDNGAGGDDGDITAPENGDPGDHHPQPTQPTGPVNPPAIQWPAPPKGEYAKLRASGRTAVAPKHAPEPIKAMIHAANSIAHKPYIWGGGHGRWYDRGYDCSGATSFVLRAGGYLSSPLVSGDLARWGGKGAGNWVRIYANRTHVFMVIAGLRFDTSSYGAGGGDGPRWRSTVRPTGGFKLRHPPGL